MKINKFRAALALLKQNEVKLVWVGKPFSKQEYKKRAINYYDKYMTRPSNFKKG